MGEPWFKLKDLAKQHAIIALNSNYALYGDMSQRIMTVLRDYSPDVEVYITSTNPSSGSTALRASGGRRRQWASRSASE